MTCPQYMERGVERRIEEKCKDCAHISKVYTLHRNDVGMCDNIESDHFGHVIYIHHPGCGKYEEAQKGE